MCTTRSVYRVTIIPLINLVPRSDFTLYVYLSAMWNNTECASARAVVRGKAQISLNQRRGCNRFCLGCIFFSSFFSLYTSSLCRHRRRRRFKPRVMLRLWVNARGFSIVSLLLEVRGPGLRLSGEYKGAVLRFHFTFMDTSASLHKPFAVFFFSRPRAASLY